MILFYKPLMSKFLDSRAAELFILLTDKISRDFISKLYTNLNIKKAASTVMSGPFSIYDDIMNNPRISILGINKFATNK
jgi:hypothetical protein